MMSATFSKEKMDELRKFNWREFKSEELKRGFLRAVSLLGDSGISDPEKLFNWKKTKSEMNRLFSTAKIQLNNSKLISLEPNISEIFHKSRDYDHLSHVWKLWRDASGKKYSKLYPQFINLSNEATREYGFSDYGAFTRSSFEDNNLPQNLDKIYQKIENLYRLLHAYVKKKLSEIYKDRIDLEKGVLPAHLLGDLWAQQWHNIFEDIKPYKNKPLLDITESMRSKVRLF